MDSRDPLWQRVAADLGDDIAARYAEGIALTATGSQEGAGEKGAAAADALSRATEVFVGALSEVPEEKTLSPGFAELLLAYGKSLLVYVRRQAMDENVFAGDVEEEIKAMAENARSKLLDVGDETVDDAVDIDVEVIPRSRAENGDGSPDLQGASDKPQKGPIADARSEQEEAITVSDVATESTTGKSSRRSSDAPVEKDNNRTLDSDLALRNTKAAAVETESSAQKNTATAAPERATNGAVDDGADNDEENEEEAEEDISTAQLAWEQLETARVIYEGLEDCHDDRLAVIHEAIGDFIVETDGYEARAADEYGKAVAAEIRANGSASRFVADLHHRRYLSLRRDVPTDAISAMEAAIESFQEFIGSGSGDEQDTETLEMLEQDLAAYKESLGSALSTVIGFKKDNPAPAVVNSADQDQIVSVPRESIPVTVQPKRRAKPDLVRPLSEVEVEKVDVVDEPVTKKPKS